MHHCKGADERNGHRCQRNDRGPPGLEEEQHDNDNEDHGFQQGVDHGVDGFFHENGRVIGDGEIYTLGKFLFQLGHPLPDVLGDRQCIRPGKLKHAHGDGALIVDQAAQRILAGAKFGASDILEPKLFAVRSRFDDDVVKFVFFDESALGVDGEFKGNVGSRLLADGAGGDLNILLANGVDDVTRSQSACGSLVRIDPDPHGIVAAAEELNLADTLQTAEFVLHIERGVVSEVDLVVAIIGRQEMHHQGHVRRGLHRRHAEASHFLG